MKRVLAMLLAASMFCIMISGCKKAPTDNQSEKTETQVKADLSETGTLNLVWHQSMGTDSLFESPWSDLQSLYPEMVYDSLLKVQEDGKTFTPKLAKQWNVSEDGLTYSFTIRDNVKWHDGTPFTIDDVMFSINATLKYPKSTMKAVFANVAGVKEYQSGTANSISGVTAKDNVLTIKLLTPDSFFMQTLCQFYILPKHLLKDADPLTINTHSYFKKPIGTGAYYIDEVSFPNYFTVQRNDNYYGPKAGIKKALFTSYATGGNEAVIAASIAGKVDFAFGNAINDINVAKNLVSKNADMKMLVVPSAAGRTFYYNNVGSTDGKYNSAVQKPEVRQALGLLLDKEMIANFYSGQASVMSSSFINPSTDAYNKDIPLFKRDVAKAKQMLTSAGFDFNKPIRLLYYYNDQTTVDIMDFVKQNFAEAGVKVEPFLAQGDMTSIIYEQKNWDMMYCASGQTNNIRAYQFLSPTGGAVDKIFADIDTRKQFTKIINDYNSTKDEAQRKKLVYEIQVLGGKYSYATHVYTLNKIVIYNKKHLQLDEAAFSADYQNMRDNRFENWKLIGQ